jgi:GNAT superfamily N-acetyltransferase
MGTTFRLATLGDAKILLELRHKSIVALAPAGMPASRAQAWAANLDLAGMQLKILELEIWVIEHDNIAVAWGAIHHDRLAGLYTQPDFSHCGIGTELLSRLEGLMRERKVSVVCAEVSPNAEGFYLRRGYESAGDRSREDALPMTKRLK